MLAASVEAPHLAQLEEISWAAYNLKQDINGEPINKIYMKTNITTLEDSV